MPNKVICNLSWVEHMCIYNLWALTLQSVYEKFCVKQVFKFQRKGKLRNWRWIRAQAWGWPHGTPSEYQEPSSIKAWGCLAHGTPSKYQEPSSVKAWGCPKHPLFFIDYHEAVFAELSFYHFTYYVLCLERLFALSFVFFSGHMLVGSLFYLYGRESRAAFSFESPVLRLYRV